MKDNQYKYNHELIDITRYIKMFNIIKTKQNLIEQSPGYSYTISNHSLYSQVQFRRGLPLKSTEQISSVQGDPVRGTTAEEAD